MGQPNPIQDTTDFSLVLGGPLYQLFRRAHLTGNTLELVRRRCIIISLLAWVPLLVLSALQGKLLSATVAVPFLSDLDVHVRFLVAIPLLIVAELVVHERMRFVANQFLERNLIPENSRPQFHATIGSVWRLRNSVLAEVLLVALVYSVGILIVWRQYGTIEVSTWYASPAASGSRFTFAGMWYGYVSMPIFQFLLLRWYFRLCVWCWFLYMVSRIDLNLTPTHPDRVGGLGFLSNTAYAFIPLALAHGAVLSGTIANRILHLGASLLGFKIEIALIVMLVQVLVFAPLVVFAAQLARTKRNGLREYGTLAARYVQEFDIKWLRGGASVDESLVGSGDIQSLADLGNSFEVVRSMRITPITRNAIVELGIATLLPVGPLLLTIMPLEELVKKLLGILL